MKKVAPLIPASQSLPEITFRVIILSIILTLILAASNAYLALKVGITIAASIPAAVVAMGVLQFFKGSNILETNIVQTAASAGEGIAAAMAFILPGFVILGFWNHFPFFDVFVIASVGGTLGILFSIPLRRVLLDHKDLLFPEGTAIGHVLRAKASDTGQLKNLIFGGLVGSLIVVAQTGFKIIAEAGMKYFVVGRSLVGFGTGYSPALLAAGYIVGANVGITLFVGALIGWLFGIPIISHFYGFSEGDTTNAVMSIWSSQLRFVGVGTMLVGGIWTILTLLKPIYKGLALSFSVMKDKNKNGNIIPRTEKDVPLNYVLWGVGLFSVIAFIALTYLVKTSTLPVSTTFMMELGFIAVVYILFAGFVSAAICGYLVGLVGTTNSPISGILLGAVLLLSLLLLPLFGIHMDLQNHADKVAASSLVLIVVSLIAGISTIANDNIQDLKAGQMVGATPWKQQLILFVGVLVSALVMGPVLELLFNAYGLGGVFPHPGMDKTQMLSAPQAGLMAAVAQGVFAHNLSWPLLISGAIVAVFCIGIDEFLKTRGYRLPVLAVGIGIYIPLPSTIPIVIGGFLSALAHHKLNKKASKDKTIGDEEKHQRKQRAVLLSCGLVAGAALTGVLLAIPFVIKGSADALRLVPESFEPYSQVLGWVATFAICFWLYKTTIADRKR